MKIEDIKEKITFIAESYKVEPISGWITGDGPIPCDILFVGEAPGKNEVEEGKPFVGMAGKNFEKYLKSIGLSREQIRITNTCYFRPVKITTTAAGKTSVSNRTPNTKEVELFREVLDQEIYLVNPKIIIILGNIPLKRLTNYKTIGTCHGQLLYNEDLKKEIFPMYHPSSLTYNRNEEFEQMYNEDWKKLKEILELKICSK